MPSLRARFFSALLKIFIRRHRWGRDENELANRARREMGAPKILQWFKTRGLKLETVKEGSIRGEWLTPPDVDAKGVILYLHGGGYVSCSAATHRPITSTLARLTHFRVFSANYRLSPENRFTAALDDAVAAYRWLIEQGINSEKIALAGDSAGGGLVLATILRLRDENMPLPACATVFSPWTDMTGSGESVYLNNGRCALFRPENIGEFGRAYLGNSSPENPYASPVFADFSGFIPVLLQVGSTELLLDDSRRIHEKIQTARGMSRLEVFEDVPHCWQMFGGLMPEARAALEQAADFICEYVKGD